MKAKSHWFRDIAIGLLVTVVGGLILKYVAGISPTDIFKWLGGIIFWTFGYLDGSVRVFRWFYFLLILLAGIQVITWVIKARRTVAEPTYRDYREDMMDGLRWRWRYTLDGQIDDLWCFCPHCDTTLIYSEDRDFSAYGQGRDVTVFRCERCGLEKTKLEGNRDYVLSRITRFIDRAIRIGDWKKVIQAK